MTRARNKVAAQLLNAARQAANTAELSEALHKRLAVCAIEAVRAEAWDLVEAACTSAPVAVQEQVRTALAYAVEHPVLEGPDGTVYNGRLFVLPVSQAIQGSTALAYLPQGEVVQRLLTEALCPGGVGVLLNRLWPASALEALSLKDIWALTNAAFEQASPGAADAPEPLFIDLTQGERSGLHFVIFMAFSAYPNSDALLGLVEDDLAVRSMAMMSTLNPLISEACAAAGQPGIRTCLHLLQSIFYDPPVIDLAHEAFLFAIALAQWVATAEEEGHTLALQLSVEQEEDHQKVVVRALAGKLELGNFFFVLDLGDTEMLTEICLSVDQLASPHGLSVTLPSGVSEANSSPSDTGALALCYIEGPQTLQ